MTYMCVHLHAPQKPQTDAPLPDTCVWMLMFMLDCFRVYNMSCVLWISHIYNNVNSIPIELADESMAFVNQKSRRKAC